MRPPIGIAVSGKQSCALAGTLADVMVATEPKPELVEMFEAAGGAGKPRVGQIAVAYDTDRDAAVERAHEQFRWFGLGWKVNTDLPGAVVVRGGDAVRHARSRSASSCRCGPDVEEHVEKIRPFVDAGFTEVALVQIGADHQDAFIGWAEEELLPALRSL